MEYYSALKNEGNSSTHYIIDKPERYCADEISQLHKKQILSDLLT